MLSGALRIILFFMNYSLSYRIEGETEGKFTLILMGIVISLVVVVINCLTRLVVTSSLHRFNCSLMLKNTIVTQNMKGPFACITQSSIL